MYMNNESKNYFNKFIKQFGLKRDKGTKRQVVIFPNGEKFSFSVSTNNKLECRQTYSDCKGFITFHYKTGKYYIRRIDNIQEYTFSRMTRYGITAHSIITDFDSSLEFYYVDSIN